MEYRVGYHLEHKLRGRQLVVWGTGRDALDITNILEKMVNTGLALPVFFISKDYETQPSFRGYQVRSPDVINRDEHYVIIATFTYREEISEELNDMGFVLGEDYYDWFMPLLPYDYEYKGIVIGKNSYFSWGKEVISRFIKRIGRFVSVNHSAKIAGDHSFKIISTGLFEGIVDDETNQRFLETSTPNKTTIGNDVWIGANTFVNASKIKTIGNGAIVGAGAVILEDVPPYAIVVGVPAKIKKYRFIPEHIEILERVKWWDWDNETINKNAKYIFNPELFFERFANTNMPD